MRHIAGKFVCLLALMLLTQMSGVAEAYAYATGGVVVDTCASGCEDEDSSSPCSPICPTCSCGLLRPMLQQTPTVMPVTALCSNGPIVARLLGAPKRVEGDGVFHPPRV